jgi:hypothetical protein
MASGPAFHFCGRPHTPCRKARCRTDEERGTVSIVYLALVWAVSAAFCYWPRIWTKTPYILFRCNASHHMRFIFERRPS